jgi:hypothetical protein
LNRYFSVNYYETRKEEFMRRMFCFIMLLVVPFFLMSCASSMPIGGLYTELKLPVTATGEPAKGAKMGTAECMSVLGLVATGDASIQTAMKNGNITRVTHVDWECKNILGIIGNYKVVVYGQ